MGFLSNLFGGNKEDSALRDAMAHIHRILDDEQFQLELVHPAMKSMLESAPAYDRDPNGTGPFGSSRPIRFRSMDPLASWRICPDSKPSLGQRILFHRLGAIGTVDVFEAVSFNGAEWFIFIDLYHPRRSRLTPDGFRFTKDVAQFSGFHKFCDNFPYDSPSRRRHPSASPA